MADAILAAHPAEIYAALEQVFAGESWLSYEPETLLLALKREVSDQALDKLLAVQAVCANPKAVAENSDAFEKAVNAFCNNICVMDVIQPPEVEELSYAVSQVFKLYELAHKGGAALKFSGEVPGYVAAVAHFRGWQLLPRNLAFAQEMLDHLTGMQEGSKLYQEHLQIRESLTELVNNTSRKDARELLESDEVKELENNDLAAIQVKRQLGALLYDPTIVEE